MMGFIWVIYNIGTSVLNSADILTSTLKIISFSMSFFIIVSSIDTKEYDWILWTLGYYTTLILLSIPLLFSPIGKLRNGKFFQGIWNHPNGFAVMLSILAILSIYMLSSKRYNRYRTIIIFNLIISVLMLIMTESRTGIISFLVVSIVFLILNIKEKIFRGIEIKGILIFLALSIISTIILVLYKDFISDYLNNMIYKGEEGDLLYSSKEILDKLWEDIKRRPILGNGFGVNSEINGPIGGFKMSSPVEKRNIILAILSESGIVGFIIFSIVILSMTHILSRKKFSSKIDSLLIVLLMVNMSEMMFFSANGIGIFIYFILGIYKSEIYNSNIIEKETQEFEESIIYN
ncbi:O-Antigen ligase family protein [[Clostridium] sordellii VPI 9048]|nr:O-Antigen ligase family protein [[Clostridium] sordellii VPI 9048] [Paeniclostridium sordellii VPI 9048]